MHIIAFLVVGLVVGWLAGLIVKGHGLGGLLDIVVGVIGAFFGGFIFNILGVPVFGFWDALGTSIVGAILLLLIVSLFTGRRRQAL